MIRCGGASITTAVSDESTTVRRNPPPASLAVAGSLSPPSPQAAARAVRPSNSATSRRPLCAICRINVYLRTFVRGGRPRVPSSRRHIRKTPRLGEGSACARPWVRMGSPTCLRPVLAGSDTWRRPVLWLRRPDPPTRGGGRHGSQLRDSAGIAPASPVSAPRRERRYHGGRRRGQRWPSGARCAAHVHRNGAVTAMATSPPLRGRHGG